MKNLIEVKQMTEFLLKFKKDSETKIIKNLGNYLKINNQKDVTVLGKVLGVYVLKKTNEGYKFLDHIVLNEKTSAKIIKAVQEERKLKTTKYKSKLINNQSKIDFTEKQKEKSKIKKAVFKLNLFNLSILIFKKN